MYLAQCTYWGHSPDRIGIWKCWGFFRRGENRSTQRKTSWSKDENQQQTQPTYDAESGNRTRRATLVGGECSHHCTIPAPHFLRNLVSDSSSKSQRTIKRTYLKCWLCLEKPTDKKSEPQKEKNTHAKTTMNLVTS